MRSNGLKHTQSGEEFFTWLSCHAYRVLGNKAELERDRERLSEWTAGEKRPMRQSKLAGNELQETGRNDQSTQEKACLWGNRVGPHFELLQVHDWPKCVAHSSHGIVPSQSGL